MAALKEMYEKIEVSAFGGPEVLEVQQFPRIQNVKPNEVLIDVRAVGINPVETYLRAGTYRKLPKLPYTPGRDCAGVVRKIGSNVQSVKVGQKVFTDTMTKGAYSQEFVVPKEDVLPLGSLQFTQGAAIGVGYRTAWRACFEKARVRAGEFVLVRGGSGSVGLAIIEMCKLAGCFIVGTSSTEEGRKAILEKGAALAFNHSAKDFREEIMKFTNNNGVNHIFEMLANSNLDDDLQLLAVGGDVIVIGNKGRIEINPRDLMMRELSVKGMIGGPKSPQELARYRRFLNDHISRGLLNPVVGAVFDLNDAPKAHEDVIAHNICKFGKVVLCPQGISAAVVRSGTLTH